MECAGGDTSAWSSPGTIAAAECGGTERSKLMLEIIVVILIYLVLCAGSWAIVVGLLKLIGLCFGFSVSLAVATGIWLVLLLVKLVFGILRK